VVGFAAFLGWRFHQSRLLFAVLLVVVAERLFALSPSAETGRFTLGAVSLLLPVNLAATAFLPEHRGLWGRPGRLRFGVVLFQILGCAWIYRVYPAEAMNWLGYSLVPSPWLTRLVLPQLSLAAFLGALLLVAIRFYRDPRILEGSFLWATAAVFLALTRAGNAEARTAFFIVAGLILLTALVEASRFIAFRDDLTGLPSRRIFNEALSGVGAQYTLAMIDLDHFKRINDRYGHDVGDQVLRKVATELSAVSGGGRAFRYGGEEFAVLFPRKSVQEVLPHLEKLRERVAAIPFRVRRNPRPRKPSKPSRGAGKAGREFTITVSVGIAQRSQRRTRPEQVLQAADKALYRAKRGGRNQIRT
jgi:diguanylate cyclase (GGDEF)-like protein